MKYQIKNGQAKYDAETWFLMVMNAVDRCKRDKVPITSLNVEERLVDIFGFNIGVVYDVFVIRSDGRRENMREPLHKRQILKALKRYRSIVVGDAREVDKRAALVAQR